MQHLRLGAAGPPICAHHEKTANLRLVLADVLFALYSMRVPHMQGDTWVGRARIRMRVVWEMEMLEGAWGMGMEYDVWSGCMGVGM